MFLSQSQNTFTQFLKDAVDKNDVVHDCDFRIVSVLGSQSSGKSTLLNALFGTHFDVMSEARRSQTTKGIWLSSTEFSREILVMDVEGTDGRERGDDQDFERKSALFSMALSEVLIVNMWEHSVGLYNGANMSLLKTVFEVNLELFASKNSPKTLLLFVIRDFLGHTSLSDLSHILTDDLQRIWNSISKPLDLINSCLSDFFKIDFCALPHKILKPVEFKSGVDALGKRFFDKQAPDYFFADATAFKKSVPNDGLVFYVTNIWTQIVTNKNLDLPTQQQLLSQFRCDEISKECFAEFDASLKPFKSLASGETFSEDFLDQAVAFKRLCLFNYESESHRYHRDIADAKGADLEKDVNASIVYILAGLAKCLCHEAVQLFSRTFIESASSKSSKLNFTNSFRDRITKAKEISRQFFDHKASFICSEDFKEFSKDSFLAAYEEGLKLKIETLIMNHCRVQMDKQRVSFFNELESLLGSFFITFDQKEEIYHILFERVCEIFNKHANKFVQILQDNLATDAMRAEFTNEFNEILNKQINKKLQELFTVDKLASCLYKIFERHFKLDKSGMPKIWAPSDNIEAAYIDALGTGISIIKLMKNEKIAESIDKAEKSSFDRCLSIEHDNFGIFFDNSFDTLEETYKKLCEATFIDTKRSVTASKTHVPLWVIILLVVLGWNEFMTILRNPLYLILGLILGTAVYFIYMLNLNGPVMAFIQHTIHNVTKQISSHLKPSEASARVPTPVTHTAVESMPQKKASETPEVSNND